MIDTPTVLILGAGASSHLKYPLGSQLVDQICGWTWKDLFAFIPSKRGKLLYNPRDIESFQARLSFGVYSSVDAFLEKNPVDIPLGKFLIAKALKAKEDRSKLFSPNNPGWYANLFRALFKDGKPNFEASRLSIITFNYDRSIEAFLYFALVGRGLSEREAQVMLRKIPIIHVHGTMGDFPEVNYERTVTANELQKISAGIKIIHEIKERKSGFCSPEFREANRLLHEAEVIAFMGFGFHIDNVRRFQFFMRKNLIGKAIYISMPGPTKMEYGALARSMSDFGFHHRLFGPNAKHPCNKFVRLQPIFS